MPTKVPIITNRPSFPNKPNDIIKTPSPGTKFESGTGKNTNDENINVKKPIILSAIG